MESAGLVLGALGRVRQMVREAISDLSADEMLAPPKPHIAWLTWHIARVQDANFSGLLERPQLWITDRWHERFGMAPNPRDYGSGHRQSREQVDAFTVTDKTLLLDYLDAVFAQTKDLFVDCYQRRFESSPRRTAILSLAHPQRPSRQRHQLQHSPRRSDRISARPGQIRRLVSWCGKTKQLTFG